MMSGRSVPISILTMCLIGPSIAAQSMPTPPGRAYKVAFWYEAARPTTSLKYQVYDLSKGEYDEKAVDRWFRTILAKHPDHGAYIRDIRTEGEPGATEAERLNLAIEREKRRWADLQRRPSKPIPKLVETSTTMGRMPRNETPSRTAFDRSSPGSPRMPSNPPTSLFPYPYRSGPR